MVRLFFLTMCLCILSAGCTSPQDSSASPAITGTSTLLTAQIDQRLASDPVASRLALSITEADGIVTIRGRIDSPEARLRAVSVVRSTPGVRAVIDKTHRY